MVRARGMSCGGRSRSAGSELAGSGWAARRFLRSSHQVSKWSTQAWMVKLQGPSLSTVKSADQRSLRQRGHGRGLPARVALVLVEQAGGDVVVAVGEDGGGDGDAVAEEAARRGSGRNRPGAGCASRTTRLRPSAGFIRFRSSE